MVDDSTKTIGNQEYHGPRLIYHHIHHEKLNKNHPHSYPFEVWVIAEKLLDLRILF
jgi:hypothetical protein